MLQAGQQADGGEDSEASLSAGTSGSGRSIPPSEMYTGVSMEVRMCACVHAYMHVRVHACACVILCTCMCMCYTVYMRVHVHV